LPRDVRDVYAFEEKIGAGAFGQVRRARDHKSGQTIAIKIILRCEQGVTYEELMVEVDCMKRMKHVNIVAFHGWYTDERFIYICMEEFRGGELMHRLRHAKRKITEREGARYVKMMLSALEYLTSVCVVHRDIKPENFLFRTEQPDSQLALIDFGLSTIIAEGDYLQTCCGTVQYISPEQIRGRYRFSGDMWAVGVVCYLLMVGKFPFKGETDSKMMAAILGKRATIPDNIKMSADARDFVLKILEPDVSQRATAAEAQKHRFLASADESFEIAAEILEAAHVQVESSKRVVAAEVENERDETFDQQDGRRRSRMSTMRMSLRQSVSAAPGARASVVSNRGAIGMPVSPVESTEPDGGRRSRAMETMRKSILGGGGGRTSDLPPGIVKSKFHDTALNYAAMQFRKSNSIAMCGDVFSDDSRKGTLLESAGRESPLRGRAVSVNNAMLPSALQEASQRKLPNLDKLQFSPEGANMLHGKYKNTNDFHSPKAKD